MGPPVEYLGKYRMQLYGRIRFRTVRRLEPHECEFAMGFPPGWADWSGGAAYRADCDPLITEDERHILRHRRKLAESGLAAMSPAELLRS